MTDWLPTIVEGIAGLEVDRNEWKLDGYNVWLTITTNSLTPRKELLIPQVQAGRIQGGGGGGGGALGAEAPPFIFRLYLINMLSIIIKFCLSIII